MKDRHPRGVGIKEPFNSISHMVGGGFALVGIPILVSAAHGTVAVASAAVYGSALVALYTMSALYHAIPHPRASAWLLRIDHATIYLLIAGTYTPVALVLYGGVGGWWLVAAEWTLAIAGLVTTITIARKPKWIDQVAYIGLGWAGVAVPGPIFALGWGAVGCLLGGGVLYTAGAALYGRNRPHVIGPLGDHEVWHLMVLAGSALHFWFILHWVL